MAEIWVWFIDDLAVLNIKCDIKDMEPGQVLKIILQSVN